MFLPFAIGFSGTSAVSGPIATRMGPRILNLGTLLMVVGLLGTIVLARLASAAPMAAAIDPWMLVPLDHHYLPPRQHRQRANDGEVRCGLGRRIRHARAPRHPGSQLRARSVGARLSAVLEKDKQELSRMNPG
jgi:hypothetical protein